MVEEAPVVHLPLGMALEDLGLLLELYHGDGLVHLGCELARLLIHLVAGQQSGEEFLAGVVAIDLHSERS